MRMRHIVLFVTALSLPAAAQADLYGRAQHGGRATAQAAAFVARADEPSAVGYNPAAIVRLEGFQLQAALDFDAPTDDYDSASGGSSASHTIQFPPAIYAVWHPDGASWAVGGGVDSPQWQLVDWDNALFPARFTARRSRAELWAAHAVAAWAPGPRWSVGGGLRYVTGSLGYGDTRRGIEVGEAGPVDFEVDRLAEGSADGIGFDLGVHYAGEGWGFGATWRSAVEVKSDGGLEATVRDLTALPADVQSTLRARFQGASYSLSEELPDTLTAGVWYAPYAELRLELDVALARWSSSSFRAAPAFAFERRNGWDDTFSIRLGVEGDLGESGWTLGGGLALEPTPAGGDAVEPGAARGDALVYAFGASYRVNEQITFDLGYSFHDFDALTARDQETDPAIRSEYASRAQVWSAGARWRF